LKINLLVSQESGLLKPRVWDIIYTRRAQSEPIRMMTFM